MEHEKKGVVEMDIGKALTHPSIYMWSLVIY